jgi:site-specific recombinase XerD
MRHCCTADLAATSETEIKAFLTHLAVVGDVTAGTQNQAKSALLFLFRMVLGRELGFLDVPRASKPERLPIVLSRQEIERLYGQFIGMP